jgi:hypothetical protein
MKNNTEEKTAYQLLLEKLDDKEFARQFTEEKQKEIEELLAQILMVTTGGCAVNGTCEEWGHENLFKIFDILKIRHKNFYLPDLLEMSRNEMISCFKSRVRKENLEKVSVHW